MSSTISSVQPLPEVLTTEEAADLLGYRCNRSVLRMVKRGLLRPLAYPRCPLRFYTADILAVRDGRTPLSDRWRG